MNIPHFLSAVEKFRTNLKRNAKPGPTVEDRAKLQRSSLRLDAATIEIEALVSELSPAVAKAVVECGAIANDLDEKGLKESSTYLWQVYETLLKIESAFGADPIIGPDEYSDTPAVPERRAA